MKRSLKVQRRRFSWQRSSQHAGVWLHNAGYWRRVLPWPRGFCFDTFVLAALAPWSGRFYRQSAGARLPQGASCEWLPYRPRSLLLCYVSWSVNLDPGPRNQPVGDYFLPLTRVSTTDGSARVLVSPRSWPSPAAIFTRMRRIILPLRVLGRASANWIISGSAIGPISFRT